LSQTVFERQESKYFLPHDTRAALESVLRARLTPDQYGEYTVASLYFDTPDFELARRAMDKPLYREKLRLRCYGTATRETSVFLELKKKFRGTSYKRRAVMSYGQAEAFLRGKTDGGGQVTREISEFLARTGASPRMLLRYDRSALAGEDGLRVTFDTGVRFRAEALRLDADGPGIELLPPGLTLMEIKTPAAVPLWLARALSQHGVFPASFSKYAASCARLRQWTRSEQPAVNPEPVAANSRAAARPCREAQCAPVS
jgi:hypothetical protein